jgi:hypothetical protein
MPTHATAQFLSLEDSQFFEQVERTAFLLRAVIERASSGIPLKRNDVVQLETLFIWHASIELHLESIRSSHPEMLAVANRVAESLSEELPVLFYSFCRRLHVDGELKTNPGEVVESDVIQRPARYRQVFHALHGAAMANAAQISPENNMPTADKSAGQRNRIPQSDTFGTTLEQLEHSKIKLPTNPDIAEVWNAVQNDTSDSPNVSDICRMIAKTRGCNAESLRTAFNRWKRMNIG